jgi:glycosyltransferase involved in cell wall biosynthesis
MKISIITVCFNSTETIEDTIRSVFAQDYDIEYIIVDGGSTDGTLDIINRYKNNIAKVVSEPDEGIYDAMNKGIRLSNGDIVATLNSDDMYASRSVVREMVEFIENHNLDAAYGDLVYVDKDDLEKVTRVWRPGEYKKGAFRYGWVPPHPTFFCRKYLFERYGFFNTKYRIAADFELMLRFIEKYQVDVGYVPKALVRMRRGGKANAIRGIIQGNREVIDAFRLNGLKLSLQFFWRKPLVKVLQLLKKPVIKSTA